MISKGMPEHAWVVRAGGQNQLASLVEEKGAIAIGWWKMGDLSQLHKRADFKARYREVYPEDSSARVGVNAGQLFRFARGISIRDYLLTYEKATRELLIGTMAGEIEHRPDVFDEEHPHVRRVEWRTRVSRDAFSSPARNSLGSLPTVFRVDDHLVEIHRLATGESLPLADIEEAEEAAEEQVPFHEEVKSRADELIADLVSNLDPYEFQDLVAGVLRAMGFRAVSSPPGRDRGVDIVAHPDALGFGRPRIKVQVKHRRDAVSGPEMRNFLATVDREENGLYVSTGGFKSDAKVEADKARELVTLLDRDAFIALLIEHYEALEPEFKATVPLREVWVPAVD